MKKRKNMASIRGSDYLAFVAAALSALTEKHIVTKIEYDRISKEVKSGKNVEYVCAGEVNVVEEIKQTYAKTAQLVAQRYIPEAERAEISQVFYSKINDTPSITSRRFGSIAKYNITKKFGKDTKNKNLSGISISKSTRITSKKSFRERMSANGNFPLFRKSDNRAKRIPKSQYKPLVTVPPATRSPLRGRSNSPCFKSIPHPISRASSPEDDFANSDVEIHGRLSSASWKNIRLRNSVQKNRSYEDINQDFSEITLMRNTKPRKSRQHSKLSDKDSDQNDSDSSLEIFEAKSEKKRLMKGKKVGRARHISKRQVTLFDPSSNEEDTIYHDDSDTELITDKISTAKKGLRTEKTIDLFINLPSGETIIVEMESKYCLVNNIKYKIKEKTGISMTEQVLHFGGYFLEDEKALHEYKIKANSTIHLSIKAKGGSKTVLFFLDSKYLDPSWDYDFTNMNDDGKKYTRGGHQYYRPYGWKRIAIKVIGKYDNNTWLGESGVRTEQSQGEWAVTYHGTEKPAFDKICHEGYKIGPRELHGKGVYSSPDIGVARSFATVFSFNGVKYQGVFQNRVNPKGVKIVKEKNYWLCSDPKNIRPYGLCVKKY